MKYTARSSVIAGAAFVFFGCAEAETDGDEGAAATETEAEAADDMAAEAEEMDAEVDAAADAIEAEMEELEARPDPGDWDPPGGGSSGPEMAEETEE